MRKLKGFDLNAVLDLYVPQYLLLLELIDREMEAEKKEYEKSKRKR